MKSSLYTTPIATPQWVEVQYIDFLENEKLDLVDLYSLKQTKL